MNYFMYISYIALLFCITMCVLHFLRIVKLGAPKDLSEESGSIPAGVLYSNTVAMLPNQKESAYMHLPTFTAGAMFHIGTFLALFCFVLLFFKIFWGFFLQHELLSLLVALYMWFSVSCGTGLIIKRVISKKLRPISNADDYISVTLTALFQFVTALLFTTFAFRDFFSSDIHGWITIAYFVASTLLFFYLPFGKLKHAVYYFAARYHLGFFYGRRGTWPPK
jgi:nitrate reductase gamma subunit